MNKEIKELIDKYIDNKDIRKFSDLYYSDFVYREAVKDKSDINRMAMGIEATLSYYCDQECLTDHDVEVMERRIAEYELAVLKILSEGEKYNYNFDELSILIDNISKYYQKISDISKIERAEKSKIGYNF